MAWILWNWPRSLGEIALNWIWQAEIWRHTDLSRKCHLKCCLFAEHNRPDVLEMCLVCLSRKTMGPLCWMCRKRSWCSGLLPMSHRSDKILSDLTTWLLWWNPPVLVVGGRCNLTWSTLRHSGPRCLRYQRKCLQMLLVYLRMPEVNLNSSWWQLFGIRSLSFRTNLCCWIFVEQFSQKKYLSTKTQLPTVGSKIHLQLSGNGKKPFLHGKPTNFCRFKITISPGSVAAAGRRSHPPSLGVNRWCLGSSKGKTCWKIVVEQFGVPVTVGWLEETR